MVKRLFVMVFAALFASSFAAPALAQDASPAAGTPLVTAAELGLPELNVRYTDAGYEAPAEVAAGRYLVTFENAGSTEFPISAGFLKIPEGWTFDDLLASFDEINAMFGEEGGEGDAGAQMATPESMESMDMASPAATEDPLAWLFETKIAGGPAAAAGEVGQAVIDLDAGEWAIWPDTFELGAAPLTVTGDMPADLQPPSANAAIVETDGENGFEFTVEGSFDAGVQIIEIRNDSTQPHFVEFDSLPGPATKDQVLQALGMLMSGTPVPADLPNLDATEVVSLASTQSSDTVQWLISDLPAGHYLIACWIPDPTREMMPHAAGGMVDVVEVK
jgi:hypothetical protein